MFFCSESDYPKFLPFLELDPSTTYDKFVARVNQRIEKGMEQRTILKAHCGFEAWLAFCKHRGHVPNYESLDLFAQHVRSQINST